MEGIHYLKANKDESLKIFSKYVRNPDLGIMAYLYEEISTRAEKDLRPQSDAMRACSISPRWTFRRRRN